MNAREAPLRRAGPAKISWGAGGWILLLALVLIGAVFLWRVQDMLSSRGGRAVGDGKNPNTYGFDLSNLTVPRTVLVGSGMPRDGLPVLDFPSVIGPTQVEALRRDHHFKYLVPGDRVIGVVRGGAARAYPLNVLNWHEVVNDTLGGSPILVTYSPLCDAVAVFERRAGDDVVLFGMSGLLYNSNLVLYDRRGGRPASLWSQLSAEAISGPAAEETQSLKGLPCALVRWDEWKGLYPETTVLAPDPQRKDRYKRDPYISYYGSDRLRFPVVPLPPQELMAYKTPCIIVGLGGTDSPFPLKQLALRSQPSGEWRTLINGVPVRFHCRTDPPTAWAEIEEIGVSAEEVGFRVVYGFWFAWYATHANE